jgi:hypothetical protein
MSSESPSVRSRIFCARVPHSQRASYRNSACRRFRKRHIGVNIVQPPGAHVCQQELGFGTRIDAKQELELGAAVLQVAGGSRLRAALIVIGDELEGDLAVKRFDVDAALRVLLVDPQLQPVMHRHGDAGEAARGCIERAELDLSGRVASSSGKARWCRGLQP